MDLNAVFLTALLLHFPIYATIAQGGYYNEVECRLLPTQNDISSEFRLKASEKGVRLVYLNLKIGNDSYRPLELQDEFLEDRWVWANNITEPMLSLPDDYDILSLGLLNYQVRSMDVHLEDQPSGCLANLNSTSQNMAVGRMLLENVTIESRSADQLSRKREVVCVAMIDEYEGYRGIVYRCCIITMLRTDQPNRSEIQCDLTVKRSDGWMDMFEVVLFVACLFSTLYLPALPLALPDCIFSLQYECDKEDRAEAEQRDSGQDESAIRGRNSYEQIIDASREEGGTTEIPVDDSSPVTCSALLRAYIQKLPDSRLSFNIKLAVMLYCILPCVFYVQIGLWLTLKKKYIHESFKKQVQLPGESASSLDSYPVGLCVALACLLLVLFLRPRDFLFRHDRCPLCRLSNIFLPMVDFPRESPDSIGNEILCHLRRVQQLPAFVWGTLTQLHILLLEKLLSFSTCSLSMVNRVSRIKRAGYVLCVLFSTLLTILVTLLGAICLSVLLLFYVVLLLFSFSPYATLSLPFQMAMYSKIVCKNELCNATVKGILMCIAVVVAVLLQFLLYNSASFVMFMLKFVMIGLYLNADIVTPYFAFFLVVTTNIYLCYGNLQNRYKEFKGLIFKYRQKTINISNGDLNTIPTSLFWFVSERVLPIATETCRMFCNMALIVMFLSLFLSGVLFFKDTYSISAVISSVSVFISGVIPALFFKRITKGKVFIGWDKIKMKRQIKTAVEQFGGMESLEMSYSAQV